MIAVLLAKHFVLFFLRWFLMQLVETGFKAPMPLPFRPLQMDKNLKK
jgi:hypothetical protein